MRRLTMAAAGALAWSIAPSSAQIKTREAQGPAIADTADRLAHPDDIPVPALPSPASPSPRHVSPVGLSANASPDEIFQSVFGRRQFDLEELPYPVIIEGLNRGDVRIKPGNTPDDAQIDTATLLDLVLPFLKEEAAYDLSLALQDMPKVEAAELQALGIDARFDSTTLTLVVNIPLASRAIVPIHLQQRRNPALGLEVIAPSPISARLNLLGGISHVQSSSTEPTGWSAGTASLEGVVNVRGLSLRSGLRYTQAEDERLERIDTTLTYDFVERMIRTEAGDLTAPTSGLQGNPRLLGLSAFRNFSTRPYENYRPTPAQSFELQQPARVSVYINGQFQREIRLQAGQYRLTDLPLRSAVGNDVILEVQYQNGEVDRIVFAAFYDFDLLKPGLTEFAFNVGATADYENGERFYDENNLALSSFYRRGITNNLTLGVNTQADSNVTQVGGEALLATGVGSFGVLGALNLSAGGDNSAVTGFYRWNGKDTDKRITLDLLGRFADENFASLGAGDSGPNYAFDSRGRFGVNLNRLTRLQLTAEYRRSRPQFNDEHGYSVLLSRRIRWGQIAATVRYDVTERDEEVSGLLSWSIPIGRANSTLNYDSRTEAGRLSYNSFANPGVGGFGYDLTYTTQPNYDEALIAANYIANRFDTRIEQRFGRDNGVNASGNDSRTTFYGGTALVYAGGHAVLSRPVYDSFVMIDTAKAAKDFGIAIDPQGSFGSDKVRYTAKSSFLGAAVAPDLQSYLVRTIRVDAPDAPAGVSVGGEALTFIPGFRSGYYVEVGDAGNVALIGRAVDANGEPVVYGGGVATTPDGEEHPFFTNAGGRLYLDGLRAGELVRLSFQSPAPLIAQFTVPEDVVGVVRLQAPITLHPQGGPNPIQQPGHISDETN